MNGFLVIDKPLGRTSSACVVAVRGKLPRGTAIGHGGTLDPDASGVLPLAIGPATRLFDYIIDRQKTYLAELQLGAETDTQDASGAVVATSDAVIPREQLLDVLPEFIGDIEQIPPMYSAIKRGGKRLYELARRGEVVERAPRICTVHGIRLVGEVAQNRFRIEIDCGKGTYIRTLCHDIGRALGAYGHMAALRRTRVGGFALDRAQALDSIVSLDADEIAALLIPPDSPIAHLPEVHAGAERRTAALNGNPMRAEWLASPAPDAPAVRIYVGGAFAGIGAPQPDGSVRFRAMLLPRG
jgi:tRNA pseudouridine55 synthase